MLIINKTSDSDSGDEEPEWDDPLHLIDMAYARVTMLLRIGDMTEHKYHTLQVFTISNYITIINYITTNKSSQLLLLVIFCFNEVLSELIGEALDQHKDDWGKGKGKVKGKDWGWGKGKDKQVFIIVCICC